MTDTTSPLFTNWRADAKKLWKALWFPISDRVPNGGPIASLSNRESLQRQRKKQAVQRKSKLCGYATFVHRTAVLNYFCFLSGTGTAQLWISTIGGVNSANPLGLCFWEAPWSWSHSPSALRLEQSQDLQSNPSKILARSVTILLFGKATATTGLDEPLPSAGWDGLAIDFSASMEAFFQIDTNQRFWILFTGHRLIRSWF